MAGLSDSAETNLLKLLFQNVTWANIGDATGLVGSSTAGSLYVSLHTADPTDSGNQTSSEATYGSYARVAVARSTGAWSVSNDTVSNIGAITFPACTSGSNTITHFAVGRASSGTGEIIGVGTCSLSVSTGITPSFAASALTAVAA
jgi:hypothetical protein